MRPERSSSRYGPSTSRNLTASRTPHPSESTTSTTSRPSWIAWKKLKAAALNTASRNDCSCSKLLNAGMITAAPCPCSARIRSMAEATIGGMASPCARVNGNIGRTRFERLQVHAAPRPAPPFAVNPV